jgi:hypothetical protein
VEHTQMHLVIKKGTIAIFVEFLVILLFYETKIPTVGYEGLGFI